MYIKFRLAFAASLICFLLLSNPAHTQSPNVPNDSLYSRILKEQRTIRVIFPQAYNPGSNEKFDVLYVLDGEWNTPLTEQLRGFLSYGKFIPANMIIVSIPNLYKKDTNMRDRDFTPTQIKGRPISGGAANFLAFLKEELIPYVNKKYPTKIENNTLYGTSLGGLFAIYVYFHEPALFRSYLTIEPSLWWDNGYMNNIASKKLGNIIGKKNTLWIASRDGQAFRDMGVFAFDSLLARKAPAELSWKVEGYPNETHFSAIWKGIYDGLRFTYAQPKAEASISNK